MYGGMMWLKLQFKVRRLHGRRYWELIMRLLRTGVWRFIRKKRERLNDAYIKTKNVKGLRER